MKERVRIVLDLPMSLTRLEDMLGELAAMMGGDAVVSPTEHGLAITNMVEKAAIVSESN